MRSEAYERPRLRKIYRGRREPEQLFPPPRKIPRPHEPEPWDTCLVFLVIALLLLGALLRACVSNGR